MINEPRKIETEIYDFFYEDNIEETLDEFITRLTNIGKAHPGQHIIVRVQEGEWDAPNKFEIFTVRLETPEEVNKRLDRRKQQEEASRQQELELLAGLKRNMNNRDVTFYLFCS